MSDIGTAPAAGHAWSAEQVVRLEGEWRRLQRDFAFHPNVEVIPLSGDPPGEYQIQYKVTTLGLDAAGNLMFVSSCPVHVWLPAEFPEEGPIVRPMAPTFHPNITWDWVHLNPGWRPEKSLSAVITRVGQMLALQAYDPDPNGVLNPVAMEWVDANPHEVPTDPAADLSADAAGGALARIAAFGPGALDDLRRRAEAVCDRLVSGDAAPDGQELRQFAGQARRTLERLLEPDTPAAVRALAEEVEELVVSMQGSASVWRELARDVEAARAVAATVDRVAGLEAELLIVLTAASEAAPPETDRNADAGDDVAAADGTVNGELSDLPSLALIRPVALSLRSSVREAEEAVAELWSGLGQLNRRPRATGVVPGRLLANRLEREAARAVAAAEPARASGAVLASLEPVLDRARQHAEAAEQAAAWAEYAEMMSRAEELVRRLSATDPATLQAYRVTAAGVTSGPFEFEKPVEVAGMSVAVANLRANTIRVIDPRAEELVAAGVGVVSVPRINDVRGAGTAPEFAVEPTGHTDELRVQLEYLLTQTREALRRLAPDGGAEADGQRAWPMDFWAGATAAALDTPETRRAVRDAHRRAAHQWKLLLGDLAALGRFKQRMATHDLLARLVEFVPRANARIETAKEVLIRTESRLAEIAARSARDVETERPIVPQHLAAEYADRVAERDVARQELLRLTRSLEVSAQRARRRLGNPKLYGSAELPPFRVLPTAPAALADRVPQLSDTATDAQVATLEGLLRLGLRDAASAEDDAAGRS
jgi:ubiquitin-protein ligase